MIGKTKGAVVRPMVAWFESRFGAAASDALVDALRPEVRAEAVRGAPSLGLVPSAWYDERLASDLAAAILRAVAPRMSQDDALADIGRVTVDASLGRISRAVLRWFASPASSARTAPVMWSLYHDTGTVSARVEGYTMSAVCAGWTPHRIEWCRVVGACAVRVLEINRCIAPRIDAHSCGAGERSCVMALSWSGRQTTRPRAARES